LFFKVRGFSPWLNGFDCQKPHSYKTTVRYPASDSYLSPRVAHIASTFFFTSGSILISSGQGRVKPSEGHLRVASTPILEPKLGKRGAGQT